MPKQGYMNHPWWDTIRMLGALASVQAYHADQVWKERLQRSQWTFPFGPNYFNQNKVLIFNQKQA